MGSDSGADAVGLWCGDATVRVLPAEGGAAVDLVLAGLHPLARTPWADDVAPWDAPAVDERTWVERWRGGWQACLPTSGQPDPGDARQGFHGAASQAPWTVVDRSADAVALEWADDDGLVATRRWALRQDALAARSQLRNDGGAPRSVAVAEHLVLGSDLLSGLQGPEEVLRVVPPPGTALAPLDYDGWPDGPPSPWPGPQGAARAVVGPGTPARVAALLDVRPPVVQVHSRRAMVTVAWEGLPHALLWEEVAASPDPPWSGAVRALGVEPTSTPHGSGVAAGVGSITLPPGGSLAWGAEMSVRRAADGAAGR